DGPGVCRSVAIEAAEDDVLVDQSERGAEAEHYEDEQDRSQPRERDLPEGPPLTGAVDASRLVELLWNCREAREIEHRVEAEAPPPFHHRQREVDERRAAEPLGLVVDVV